MRNCATLVLFVVLYVEKSLQTDCSDVHNCVDCVKKSSWLGHCRWCPLDCQCHATGSMENPCKESDNIHDPNKCPAQCGCDPQPTYDPNLSFNLFQYAALAYSDYPEECKQTNDASNGRQVIGKFSKNCDVFGYDCFAYLAVDRSQNAIILSYRGSTGLQALVEALETALVPGDNVDIGGNVNHYFNNGFEQLWGDILPSLQSVIQSMPGAKVWLTGHSLGGAMASLASSEIAYLNLVNRDNIYLYTYGQPRVGDYTYAQAHNRAIRNNFRVVNEKDLVPHIPWCAVDPISDCTTKYSYHHQQEIWFQNGMTYGPDQSYRTCPNPPCGECQCCSDDLAPKYSIDDHSRYFGLNGISSFQQTHCDTNRRQATPAMRIMNRVEYRRDAVSVCKVVTAN